MQWCRLYKDFATDPKVQSMPEKMQRRLVMLFCWHIDYEIMNFSSNDLWMMNALGLNQKELLETKKLFMSLGFIGEDWVLENWGKRQPIYSADTT